jgi:putative membrane protein
MEGHPLSLGISILTGLIAVEHAYFMVLEMFLWQYPVGLKAFGNTPEAAKASAVLAANQGLYNGFLAAGLAWSLATADPGLGAPLRLFFLACVSLAGLYGAYSVSRRIFFIQALPALIALLFTALWSHA